LLSKFGQPWQATGTIFKLRKYDQHDIRRFLILRSQHLFSTQSLRYPISLYSLLFDQFGFTCWTWGGFLVGMRLAIKRRVPHNHWRGISHGIYKRFFLPQALFLCIVVCWRVFFSKTTREWREIRQILRSWTIKPRHTHSS
jgi:hypothetical protein